MSFSEYLRDRISNDYKNLIAQKLEEIRQQTEQLKDELQPFLSDREQTIRQLIQNELAKVQNLVDQELSQSREGLSGEVQSMIEKHVAGWYEAETSPSEQQLQTLVSDIVSHIPEPPRTKSKDIESLADLIRKLDQQNTQSEILNTLLKHISGWVDRAVLFVVKGDQALGWAALGLGHDWNTERVRAIRVDLNTRTILSEALQSGDMLYGGANQQADNEDLFSAIGSSSPKTIVACPIKVRGKIAGALYCDLDRTEADANPDLPELLFLASRAAGFAIDLLPIKPKTASPAKEAQQSVPPPVPQSSVAPLEPPPPPAPPVEVTAPVPTSVEVETVQETSEEESEGTVVMPLIVPPPVLTEEEQKLHDDAKRFARLLVSEIKLYNEAQVAAGREHRDLYERLREDIERSRRMYQDRVPSHIHSSTNYFYEELVRTLANGDPQLLGM